MRFDHRILACRRFLFNDECCSFKAASYIEDIGFEPNYAKGANNVIKSMGLFKHLCDVWCVAVNVDGLPIAQEIELVSLNNLEDASPYL